MPSEQTAVYQPRSVDMATTDAHVDQLHSQFSKDLFVIFQIFSFLDARDICRHASLVCKKWFLLSSQNFHWSQISKSKYNLNWHFPISLTSNHRHSHHDEDDSDDDDETDSDTDTNTDSGDDDQVKNKERKQKKDLQLAQERSNIINKQCLTSWKTYYKERKELELGSKYRLDKMEYLMKRYRHYPNPLFLKEMIEWTNRELHKADDNYFDTWLKMLLASEDEYLFGESVERFMKPSLYMTRYHRDESELCTEINSEARFYLSQIYLAEQSTTRRYIPKDKRKYSSVLYVNVKYEFEQNRASKHSTTDRSGVISEMNAELYIDIEYSEGSERKVLFTWQGYELSDEQVTCNHRTVSRSDLEWLLERITPSKLDNAQDKLRAKVMTPDLLLQFLIIRLGGSPETLLLWGVLRKPFP